MRKMQIDPSDFGTPIFIQKNIGINTFTNNLR